jgi:hypothetical protein
MSLYADISVYEHPGCGHGKSSFYALSPIILGKATLHRPGKCPQIFHPIVSIQPKAGNHRHELDDLGNLPRYFVKILSKFNLQ